MTVCLQNISLTGTIHPGIFHGRTLWADSISFRAITIASREQFKPIRIGEKLVVNYNSSQKTLQKIKVRKGPLLLYGKKRRALQFLCGLFVFFFLCCTVKISQVLILDDEYSKRGQAFQSCSFRLLHTFCNTDFVTKLVKWQLEVCKTLNKIYFIQKFTCMNLGLLSSPLDEGFHDHFILFQIKQESCLSLCL